ncbi:hypothetical protein SBDP1_540007 [Syntrophobacter sp. SbD1]|nr:hypothetical protein SBDP1_540007 [Syntrophobacter sp. SbD1]
MRASIRLIAFEMISFWIEGMWSAIIAKNDRESRTAVPHTAGRIRNSAL